MQVLNKTVAQGQAKYSLTADDHELKHFLEFATSSLAGQVKVPGFRPGKAPAEMVQKHADQSVLQNEFLNHGVNELFSSSLKQLNLRSAGDPKITITKFVPYSTLELSIEVPVITSIKLPDYASLGVDIKPKELTKDQLEANIEALRKRAAKTSPSAKPIKNGDEALIDFEGHDAKTKASLPAAGAQDYRLVVGDNTLIPGFETNLVGLKTGDSKDFTLTFPKDYPDKTFASRKVSFKVTVKAVNELELPKLDDKFASLVGPFKSLDELRSEIKKQLEQELARQTELDRDNAFLNALAEKTTVEIPKSMVEEEVGRLSAEAKQSAVMRGQTWEEFLKRLDKTEAAYQKELSKVAKNRITAGLAVGEIATEQKIDVSQSELDAQLNELKTRYAGDQQMLDELDKEHNRREIIMRMVTEKVLNYLKSNQKSAAK